MDIKVRESDFSRYNNITKLSGFEHILMTSKLLEFM